MEVRAHVRRGVIGARMTTNAVHATHGSVARVRTVSQAAAAAARGATVASARSSDDAGEVGRAQFDEGVGVASFRGFKVVNELEIELEVGAGEETSDGCPAPRGSGAGRVGMAGFDSYPGFASFTWMSEDEFEIYEDGHTHDDDGHGHSHGGSSSSSAGEVDPETKALYAGIATASALIAAKTVGVLPKLPEIPMSFTSLIAKENTNAAPAKKQKTSDASSAKSKKTQSMTSTDFGISDKNIQQVAGAALASSVGIATLVGLSGSTSSRTRRRMSTASGSDYGVRSLQRLEELREAMLMEFLEEQRQLGMVKQGKSEKMKGLDDKFQSTLREIKRDVLQQDIVINGIQQQSAEEQQRALAMLMKEHEAAMKALADAYEKQEAALTAKIARLEAALKETETALAEIKEAMQNMESRHETELRAARGLIRAERELGQSEAAKYRAARDLQKSHVSALKADLALTQLNSSEKFAFLEQQLKDICSSYSARILKEREVTAAALEQERENASEEQIRMLTAFAAENRSTPRADLIAAVAELRAQAEAEKKALAATYEGALRGAAGERRALKALHESELKKAGNGSSLVSAEISQLKSQLAAAEVSSSQRLNEEIRKAQIDFEQRVVTLKKTHMAQLEQAQRQSSSASGGDAATKALSESHQVALNAMQKAHADAMQAALAKADKRVADAEALLRERISNMKSTSDAEKAQLLAKLGAERESIIAEVKSEQSLSSAEVEKLKQEYENLLVSAVAQVQSLASADTAALKAALKASTGERRALYAMMRTEAMKKSSASKVDFASEVVATEARVAAYWEQKIKDAEAAKDAQTRQLVKSYETKLSEARSAGGAGDELVKVVAALKKELDEQRAQAEQTLVAAVAEIQASAAADKAAVTALVRTETEDAFKAEKDAIMKAHALEIEALQNAAKTTLSGEEAMKMKQVEDLVKAKLAEAEIAARNASQSSTSSTQSAVTALEKRLLELQKEHEAKITELNKANKVAAMKSEDDLRKQLSSAKKELERFNRESKSSKRTLAESITYSFKDSDAELKLIRKERDALQAKVRRMEEEYSKKLASANSSNAVTELQAELDKARMEREQDLQAMMKRVEAEKLESERALRAELEVAKKAMKNAESQYAAAMASTSAAPVPSSTERGFWSSVFKGNSIDARIEEQASLRAAAESEVKEARAREVELRQRVDALTAEIQGASSQAAKDVAALKEKLDKAMDEASKNLASATDAVVQKYEARISDLEASNDKTVAVVATLQAEAEKELTSTVAKLMTEREQAIAAAEQTFAAELAKVKADAESSEAAKLAEASAMQAKMVSAQQDVITWKDQANSYKAELTKLQTERTELLTKLKNSQDTLTSNIAQSIKESKERDEEIVRAVAKSMADATVEFNAKLQASQQQAREAESKLLNLRSVFETRAREVAQQTTKDLKEREVTLEKKLRQAQRDYAQQGKIVESLEHRLSTVKSQMEAAEKKWNRLQREMTEEFEQRLTKETVPLAEKIAFYEQRVETLKEEVKTAKKSRSLFGSNTTSADPNAPAPVIVKRALFEFNRDKLQAEAEAREEAERALTAATEEMQALKLKLEAAQAEVEKAKEAARLEAQKNVSVSVSPFAAIFARMFGTPSTSKSVVEEKKEPAVVADLTKSQSLQAELDATTRTLADLKAKYAAEIAAGEAAVRKEYESKLTSLKSTVSTLESQLASANKTAEAKLAAAMKAAEQEQTAIERSLRSEIAAAKQLAASAKVAAEREYQTALREANAKAKKELEKQAREAAAARAESEKRIRESAKKAIDKLKAEIADFDARLDARDEDIERKFNAQFDKLVEDFRREVEKLQRRAKDAESIAIGKVGADAFAENSAKIDNLRTKYERELQDTIITKDNALRQSRAEAAKSIASEKTKAQEKLEKQLDERERQIKLDRQKLERSFEKTEAKDAEIKALKQSLDQAEKKLREFKDLSDKESDAISQSKAKVKELKAGTSKTTIEASDDIVISTVESTMTVTKTTETSEKKTGLFKRFFESSSNTTTKK